MIKLPPGNRVWSWLKAFAGAWARNRQNDQKAAEAADKEVEYERTEPM